MLVKDFFGESIFIRLRGGSSENVTILMRSGIDTLRIIVFLFPVSKILRQRKLSVINVPSIFINSMAHVSNVTFQVSSYPEDVFREIEIVLRYLLNSFRKGQEISISS